MKARLSSHWPLKLVLAVGACFLICGPYFLLQLSTSPPLVLTGPEFPLLPWTVWWYVSLYPFLFLTYALIEDKEELLNQVKLLSALTVISHFIFYFFPTAVESPAYWEPYWPYDLVRHFDGQRNACPSLHATFVGLGLLIWRRLWQKDRSLRHLRVPVVLWGGLILLSTLTTAQHVPVDLVAGLALAWIGWLTANNIGRNGNDDKQ